MKNLTNNDSVNTILLADAQVMEQGNRLMPISLAEHISKVYGSLVPLPVMECYDRFADAVQACRNHKEAFGFIPNTWADYMTEVKLNIKFKENPTNEAYIDVLIQVQTKRLALVMRIAASASDDTQEELMELKMEELIELSNDLFPGESRRDGGSFGRGLTKKAA